MNNIRERIKYLLRINSLTVVEFVERSGISQSTMTRILSKSSSVSKDSRGINRSTAKILANSFQVDIDFILTGKIKCNSCNHEGEIDSSSFTSDDYSNFSCPYCEKRLYRMFGLAILSKNEPIVSFGKSDIAEMANQQKYLYDVMDNKIENLIDNNSTDIEELKELLSDKWDVYNRIERLKESFNLLNE